MHKVKKPFWGIWFLLASSLALFAFCSYTGGPEVFGHELKTTDIYSQLTYREEVPDTVPEINIPPFEPVPVKPLLDTASKSILFIGDSMLGGLSPRLAAYSDKNGHTLNSIIWNSASTYYWGKDDTLSFYLNKFKPDYMFICLGANELFVRNVEKIHGRYIDHMLEQIGDIPYIWIGPPNWKEDSGINDLLARKLKPGTFFLSKDLEFRRIKDGIHPTSSSAAEWMDHIASWVMETSCHPIRLEVPEQKKSRPAHTIVLEPLRSR